jgi:hypothetical protein
LDNNGYLKILNIKKDSDSYGKKISVIVKVLQPTGSLYYSYNKNDKPYLKICVDLFDSEGNPIKGCSSFVHDSAVEVLPGEIKKVSLCYIGDDVKSYRVWLPTVPKQKQPSKDKRR